MRLKILYHERLKTKKINLLQKHLLQQDLPKLQDKMRKHEILKLFHAN